MKERVCWLGMILLQLEVGPGRLIRESGWWHLGVRMGVLCQRQAYNDAMIEMDVVFVREVCGSGGNNHNRCRECIHRSGQS